MPTADPHPIPFARSLKVLDTALKGDARMATAWWILGIAALVALVLILPGQAVVTRYVNDILIFLDGAYRVDFGQVPNRDFHSALGPLVYVIPALALRMTGSLGTAMPVGMGLVVIGLAPAFAQLISSRLRPALALPFAALLLAVLAAPINPGDPPSALSFGMFYNRIGWAALAGLLVMQLRPGAQSPLQRCLDSLAAAFLCLVLIYTKATYGVVAMAFLMLLALVDRPQWRTAFGAIGFTVATMLAIEAAWHGSAAYVADLVAAHAVDPAVANKGLAAILLQNSADHMVFALLVGLALHASFRWADLLLYSFCAGAGLLLLGQNFQEWGIVTLYAGAFVALENLARGRATHSDARHAASLAAGASLVAGALLVTASFLPLMAYYLLVLGLHAGLAGAKAGAPFDLPNYAGLRLADLGHGHDHETNARYLATLREGVSLLRSITPPPKGVFVLDFVSPFASIGGLVPLRGDTAWLHWGRNVNDRIFVPPEQLFGDVDLVLEPKETIEGITEDHLRRVYGGYLRARFQLMRETPEWNAFRRRSTAEVSDGASRPEAARPKDASLQRFPDGTTARARTGDP